MKYLSVCSGIEAASVAWHPLGWEPVAFAEIDPFASAVLAERFPGVRNLGNMEAYREWQLPAFDVLVGGTPCQSFSVAGLRKGLDDPRGNLALVYLGLLDRFRPRWCVWENVPGVLSSSGGRDFGAFLGGLAKLGYGFAYRVLDAQYVRVESHPHAVPQRRRRVFVVGCAGGDWRSAAKILLEPEGVRGDPPTRRQTRQGAARGAAEGARGGSEQAGVANSLTARMRKGVDSTCHGQALIPAISGPLGGAAQSGGFRTTDLDNSGAFIPSFAWPVEVADPITANEGATYTHKGSHNFRLHNVVPAALAEPAERDEPLPFDTTQVTNSTNRSAPQHGDPCHPLARQGHAPAIIGFASNLGTQGGDVFEGVSPTVRIGSGNGNHGKPPAVAFTCKDYGGDVSAEVAPTLRAMPHDGSHANGGGQVAVAFKASHYTRDKDGAPSTVTPPLSADAGKGDQDTLVAAPTVYTLEVRGREDGRRLEYRQDGTANALRVSNGGRDGMGVGAVAAAFAFDPGQSESAKATHLFSVEHTAPLMGQRVHNSLAVELAAPTLTSQNDPSRSPQSSEVTQQVAAVHASSMVVRRLMPVECERLQGFPDGWTAITYRGKPAADGPRYKALGNSMAVNVMAWIGERIYLNK